MDAFYLVLINPSISLNKNLLCMIEINVNILLHYLILSQIK